MNSQGDKDENKRLPMHWSDTQITGIAVAPAGADNVEQRFQPLDEQLKEPLSIVNYYKRALRIRNENPEIARGRMSLIEELTDENVCAMKKVYEGSELIIICNIGKEAASVDLTAAGYGSLQIRGYLTVDRSKVTLTDGNLSLPYDSIAILK
jgi:glycosidase